MTVKLPSWPDSAIQSAAIDRVIYRAELPGLMHVTSETVRRWLRKARSEHWRWFRRDAGRHAYSLAYGLGAGIEPSRSAPTFSPSWPSCRATADAHQIGRGKGGCG